MGCASTTGSWPRRAGQPGHRDRSSPRRRHGLDGGQPGRRARRRTRVLRAGCTRSCASSGRGDWVYFTGWKATPTSSLDGPGTELGNVLGDLAHAGRACTRAPLALASAPGALQRTGQHCMFVARGERGGRRGRARQRIRRGGSHHQKSSCVLHARPTRRRRGVRRRHRPLPRAPRRPCTTAAIAQPIELDPRYGDRPPWHDIQLEVRGPGGRRRRIHVPRTWEDPTPLDHRNPVRSAAAPPHPATRREPIRTPADRRRPAPSADRTRSRCSAPIRRSGRGIPFAPDGERSIARAYLKAFGRARAARLPRGPVPVVARTPPTRSPTRCGAIPSCS